MGKNVFSDHKNRKKVGLIILAVLVLISIITGIRIQSVSGHKQEQESLQADHEQLMAQLEQEEQSEDTEVESEDESQTELSEEQKEEMLASGEYVIDEQGQMVPVSSEAIDESNGSGSSAKNAVSGNQSGSDAGSAGQADSANTNSGNAAGGAGSDNSGTSDQNNANQPATRKVCYIEVRCDTLSQNMDKLTNKSLEGSIPSNGTIIASIPIEIKDGDTVFTVLQQATLIQNIALNVEYTASFGTYYIKSIDNLGERDAGSMSGWMYSVNGNYMQVGASSCKVNEGDRILWSYTCDGGNDL